MTLRANEPTKMPTILWLATLPDEYRDKAIMSCYKILWDAEIESLSYALQTAFVWKATPEGHEYWDSLHKKVLKMNRRAISC